VKPWICVDCLGRRDGRAGPSIRLHRLHKGKVFLVDGAGKWNGATYAPHANDIWVLPYMATCSSTRDTAPRR